MKKSILLFTLLALAACIPVDDFGAYWDKGYVEPGMLGNWQAVTGVDRQRVRVGDSGESYRMDSMDKVELGRKDYVPVIARTLKVGNYTFLMTGPRRGDLVRYKRQGDTLITYSLNATVLHRILKIKYPRAKNIETSGCDRNCSAHIRVFDNEVYAILASIPDTPSYWDPEVEYNRLR